VRKIYLYTCLFLLSSLFIYCKSDDDTDIVIVDNPFVPSAIRNIDEEFLPHVDSFLTEMESRGLDLKNQNLTVVFVNRITGDVDENVCGYGWHNFNGRGYDRVEIIDSENCWGRRDAIEKENIIYHELGHALLNKSHFTDYFPNGLPKSLMCSEGCNNYRTYIKYQADQRTYYLDQLRSSQIPMPEWAGEKIFSDNLYNEHFDDLLENWDTAVKNDSPNSNRYTFFIDNDNTFSTPSSLGISSKADATSDAYAYWYKDFNVSEFDACANIKVRADIITKNLTEGNFFLVVDLYDSNDEFFTLYYNSIDNIPGTMSHENFETTAICLPLETSKIRVRLYLDTKIETSIFIDNLEIELYQ
jgi:hypothetical protein